MFSPPKGRQSGNIMVYILIAIALFGGLTLVLSRQNAQSDAQDLSDEQIALQVHELLTEAAAARAAVDTMILAGSEIDDLVFWNPSSAEFSTDTIHNIYHPEGGGLNYKAHYNLDACMYPAMDDSENDCDISINRNIDVEGTPTSADDVIFYAHRVTENICGALNKELTGDTTIPTMTVTLQVQFLLGGTDMDATTCPGCVDQPALCVQSSGGVNYGFYSLLAVQ